MPITTAGRDYICDAIHGTASPAFNAANSYIGVGTGSGAFASSNDHTTFTSLVRKVVDGAPTQPAANTMRWVATFATGDANQAWNEWGVFNASSGAVCLNRKVESLGTKTSAQTWQFTVDVTITVPAS
jgi:hypothetical protein